MSAVQELVLRLMLVELFRGRKLIYAQPEQRKEGQNQTASLQRICMCLVLAAPHSHSLYDSVEHFRRFYDEYQLKPPRMLGRSSRTLH